MGTAQIFFPLDAVIASLILLVPGFVALKIVFAFPIVTDEDPIQHTTTFLLYALAASVVIQLLYYYVTGLGWLKNTFARFNVTNITENLFKRDVLLGLLFLLALSVFVGLFAGLISYLFLKFYRRHKKKARVSKTRLVWNNVFDRSIGAFVLLVYDDYAYQGCVKSAPGKQNDHWLLLENIRHYPVVNGCIAKGEKGNPLVLESMLVDISKVNQILVLGEDKKDG